MEPEIQYDLYLAAFLKDFNKNVLIPDFWCDIDWADCINEGLNRNKNHLIFISPDLNRIPDFSLPIRTTLDMNTDGCYFAKILRAFNSKSDALEYVGRRRQQIPAVYNKQRSENRTTEQTKLLSTNEYNNALGAGFSAMNHRFVVKTEKFCDEVAELRKRIVDYNNMIAEGTDGLDDSDIEFLCEQIDDDDSDIEYEAITAPVQSPVVDTEAEPNDENSDDALDSSTDQVNTTYESAIDDGSSASNVIPAEKEFDPLSGHLDVVITDSDDHYYPEFDAGLRASIVKCLVGWNTTHPFNTNFYDKRFVGVLLKELLGSRYAANDFEPKRISLIKSLFAIRVNDDENRLQAFDSIVAEKKRVPRTKRMQIEYLTF